MPSDRPQIVNVENVEENVQNIEDDQRLEEVLPDRGIPERRRLIACHNAKRRMEILSKKNSDHVMHSSRKTPIITPERGRPRKRISKTERWVSTSPGPVTARQVRLAARHRGKGNENKNYSVESDPDFSTPVHVQATDEDTVSGQLPDQDDPENSRESSASKRLKVIHIEGNNDEEKVIKNNNITIEIAGLQESISKFPCITCLKPLQLTVLDHKPFHANYSISCPDKCDDGASKMSDYISVQPKGKFKHKIDYDKKLLGTVYAAMLHGVGHMALTDICTSLGEPYINKNTLKI